MKMTWKTISGIVGATVAGIAIMLSATIIAYPAISSLAGLAVAQSATQWNNVIDAAKGDGQQAGILGTSTYLFNGLTFDRVRGTGGAMNVAPVGATTPSDAFANPTTAQLSFSLAGTFNGTTWDRLRSATADALAATGLSSTANQIFNGTTWDRVRAATADALASTGIQSVNMGLFNGSTFDRWDGANNTNNTATTSIGIALTTPATTWFTVPNTTSAAATAATVSKAAGGGTVRHVVTGVTMCFQDSAINTVARLVNLRDGATGAGTIIKSWYLSNGGVAGGAQCEEIAGLNISGSANTAMTLEFAAAPAATASETVSFQGYSTP